MANIKMWLLGAALTAGVAAFSPALRKWLKGRISAAARNFYGWLFLRMPALLLARLDYKSLPPAQKALLLDALRNIVYYLVRIEEILLPDAGLGAEKKARVLAKLRQLGIPDSLGDMAATLIDDAVVVMNEEAQLALHTYPPVDTPRAAAKPEGGDAGAN